jgi:hypothetical protein
METEYIKVYAVFHGTATRHDPKTPVNSQQKRRNPKQCRRKSQDFAAFATIEISGTLLAGMRIRLGGFGQVDEPGVGDGGDGADMLRDGFVHFPVHADKRDGF